MTPSQLRRREALLARSGAILDHWPKRTGRDFVAEMTTVANGLQALAEEASATGGDPLEVCRTWRFAGNAYFDLGNGKELPEMRRAVDAFRKADAHLEHSDDPIERMKLDYSFGHALFHLCDGKDIAMAREARDRYASAYALARTNMPAGVADAREALASAERLLATLETVSYIDTRIRELKEKLAGHESPAQRNGWPSEVQGAFDQLQSVYRQDVQVGKVSPVRQQALGPVLDRLGEMLNYRPDDLAGKVSQDTQLRELAARVAPLLGETGPGPELSLGSRAEAVWRRFAAIKTFLAQDMMRPHGGSETQCFCLELYSRCGHADTFVHRHSDDDGWVREYERAVLRQLALNVRDYSLRNHLTLARPIWPSPPLASDPSGVFYAGGARVQQLLSAACERSGLMLSTSRAAKDHAAARWDQCRMSHVAVFDYTGYRASDPSRPAELAVAAPVATVSYELGIALTLGRPVVIVANEGQDLPFDVDITPLRLQADGRDEARVVDALDDAIYGLQRGGSGNSLSASRAYLEQRFANHPNFVVSQSVKLIEEGVERDPIKFRRFVEPVLGAAGEAAPQMIFPAWPGSYPAPIQQRLFHVTAFGPAWAADTMKIAAQACGSALPTVQYIRGDQVMDSDIIRSIWDNLCQATHVLVDLTGLNANVTLELGIAHTLGTNVELVTQDAAIGNYFPAIAKRRVHRYAFAEVPGTSSLSDLLRRFLHSPPA
jgi:hypothetical protein